MAQLTGPSSAAEVPTEIAPASADGEGPTPALAPPAGDLEPAELPSFQPLPDANRWRKAGDRAPRADKSDTQNPVHNGRPVDALGVSRAGHNGRRRTAAEAIPEGREIGQEIARAENGGSSFLLRLAVPSCILALGIGIGLGIGYLREAPNLAGGSYAEHMRTVISFVTGNVGAVPTSSRNESRSIGGVVNGSGSQSVLADSEVLPRSGDRTRASNTGLAPLVAQAERQIGKRQWEQPPSDNALETYHRMVALSPQDPATTSVGERLSTALWSLAMDAKAAEHWDEAVHYLDILNTLPPVPAGVILARSAGASAGPAQRGQVEASEETKRAGIPKQSDVSTQANAATVGRSKETQTPLATGDAADKLRSSDGVQAPAMAATSTSSASQETGLLALNRGDAAMRSGDVAAARRFYHVSVSAGLAGAPKAIARTYDPLYLELLGVRGLQGDVAAAKRWYEKAIAEGDADARVALNRMLNTVEKARQ